MAAHAVGRELRPQFAKSRVRRSPGSVLPAEQCDQSTPRIVRWRAQRRGGDDSKLLGRRLGDFQSRLTALLNHELGELIADQSDSHVVVVQCAERFLDRFHTFDLPLTGFAELRTEKLERIPKTLGGYP